MENDSRNSPTSCGRTDTDRYNRKEKVGGETITVFISLKNKKKNCSPFHINGTFPIFACRFTFLFFAIIFWGQQFIK